MFLCCVETIKDVFTNYHSSLTGVYDKPEIEAVTLLVCEEVLALSRSTIKAFPEKEISLEQSARFKHILTQLQTGKPVQYILGYTEFYGLKFLVNPSVLIPRPETEELVEWVLSVCGGQFAMGNILDIGTGSGCIAISLKKNLQEAEVSAIDISAEALETAKKNALLNNVAINFLQGDILDKTSYSPPATRYSIIISNPPYVTLEDKQKMHANVTGFEPHTALFVPEKDPLIFYKAIADFAANNLAGNGLLFFEINESYGQATIQLLADKGFNEIKLRKDMSGRDRMIKAAWLL